MTPEHEPTSRDAHAVGCAIADDAIASDATAKAPTVDPGPDRVPTRGLLRWSLLAAGLLCAGLGAAGAVLPLLPTTPFLLLAGACFVRSWPGAHRKLLSNRLFGPYLAQWRRDRTVPRAAKRKAYVVVVLTFAVSIACSEAMWLRLALAALCAALIAFLAWLPLTDPTDDRAERGAAPG